MHSTQNPVTKPLRIRRAGVVSLGILALLPMPGRSQVRSVPQCPHVTLTADYLAQEQAGQGSGFLLQINNNEAAAIAIPDPLPLSVHWYAEHAGHWLWRASGGSGGSLVNALHEHGPLFAAIQAPGTIPFATRVIQPHASYSWTVFTGQTPALQFRPGCEHCTYQGEDQFRAVLAYAFIPAARSASSGQIPLLPCGLRSAPVVMPPLSSSGNAHNSLSRPGSLQP